jgi:parallel beta-helix repeat protein
MDYVWHWNPHMEQKTVFISYRRTQSRHLAGRIAQILRVHGFDVFLDVDTIDSGDFGQIILNQIATRAHFILVISRGSLKRCKNPDDWLLREIQEAIRLGRNIVPVVDEGSDFFSEIGMLPSELRDSISHKNTLPLNHFYFDSGMEKLQERFLKTPQYIQVNATPAEEPQENERRLAKPHDARPIVPSMAYTAELVVDVRGRGTYTTINAALKAAPAGARIIVRPGVYQESLVLDKLITIEGDGIREQIIIETQDTSCIVMNTEVATISGLSLRSFAKSESNKRKKIFAVDIPQGNLLLHDCEVTSMSHACIAIYNARTRPNIVDCLIQNGKIAILIEKSASGVIQGCEIANNDQVGIEIAGRANPTVRNCAIHHNTNFASGIRVHHAGNGVIEHCELYNNSGGISVDSGGDPRISHCLIHHSEFTGIDFGEDSTKGVITDCTISRSMIGIGVTDEANPSIRRCKITDNEVGVLAYDYAKGSVADCDLRGNTKGAWMIEEDSDITRFNNQE